MPNRSGKQFKSDKKLPYLEAMIYPGMSSYRINVPFGISPVLSVYGVQQMLLSTHQRRKIRVGVY
jgi:hypothetical protein